MDCLLYSTHPSLEQARESAAALVDEKLAACCNILPSGESHYVWQGERIRSEEVIMFSKTTGKLAEPAMLRLKTLHPYECPAILKLPINGGNPAFMAWVEEMLKPPVDQA